MAFCRVFVAAPLTFAAAFATGFTVVGVAAGIAARRLSERR
jgi:hypothetical protein